MHTPQIVEIIRRADQGATRPFICRADDGKIYYVKGKSASTGERIREWMGGNLAKAFGLNVPPVTLLEVPRFLIDASPNPEIQNNLGAGYAVGSQQISPAHEFLHEEISLISISTQRQILLFDYWVRNEDRTLSELGGNPNLLWNKVEQILYAIDYNLILQDDFDTDAFWQTHAFSQTARMHDLAHVEKQQFQTQFQTTLKIWPTCWQQLPEEWLEENEATTAFNEATVLKQLQDDAAGKIWRNIQP